MSDTKTIEDLSKEINQLRNRLNGVICVLAIVIIIFAISFLQTLYPTIMSNPGLLFLLFAIVGIGGLVSILVFLDIHIFGKDN